MKMTNCKLAAEGTLIFCLIILLCAPALGDTALVPAGSVWKYLDNGSDQGSAWREPGFDDGSWLSGPAQFGYGDGDEATLISYGANTYQKYVTTYFRHSFSVWDTPQIRGLKLKLLRDDGALVYLNGVEVARSNMPSGAINYLTLASTNVTGGDEDIFVDSFIDPELLSPGTNVLAVEIHQASITSSDVSFDLELLSTGLMRKAPYLIYSGSAGEMKVLWQFNSTGVCTVQWGTDTLYSSGSQQTSEFGNDHQHACTIAGLTPSVKYYYRVVADSEIFTGSFRAAPSPDTSSIKFIVYGDSRSFPMDHDFVADGIVSTYAADPGFQSVLLSVGDLVNKGDQESDWDTELFDAGYPHIQEMLATLPYESAMGNHEMSGVLFAKYFPYPFVDGRYWSFDYGPAHFVMVDQYTDYGQGSAQLTWIENDLASTPKPWKFLVMHEPGWSAGGHANDTTVQNYIQPLCEKYGVAILFAGHNHYYARAEVNGVEHITTGGGGAPLSPPDTTYPYILTATRTFHYCKIEIDRNSLTFTAVTPSGNVIDGFTLVNTPIGIEEPRERAPGRQPRTSDLFPGAPNPFSESTRITFSLATPGEVSLLIYDVSGKKVRTLLRGPRDAAKHELSWDGRDDRGNGVGSGVYVCKLTAGGSTKTKKMVLLR